MQKYARPVCASTKDQAKLFCCFPGCELPAFACSKDCLLFHEHEEFKPWDMIEESVRLALELPLEKEDVYTLEQQDKQIQIIIAELKTLQQSHYTTLRQCRKNLTIKENADKISQALKDKTKKAVTGGDMCVFIAMLQEDGLFANLKSVKRVMKERNTLIDGLYDQLTTHIAECKSKIETLTQPTEIPQTDKALSIHPAIAPKFYQQRFLIDNRTITVIAEQSWKYYPLLIEQQLRVGESFDIKIVEYAEGNFTIGVATKELANQVGEFDNKNSICMNPMKQKVYAGEEKQSLVLGIQTRDRITVINDEGKITWLKNNGYFCQAKIPQRLASQPLFPTLWIRSYADKAYISKLRFL